jgi:hypothetical protein
MNPKGSLPQLNEKNFYIWYRFLKEDLTNLRLEWILTTDLTKADAAGKIMLNIFNTLGSSLKRNTVTFKSNSILLMEAIRFCLNKIAQEFRGLQHTISSTFSRSIRHHVISVSIQRGLGKDVLLYWLKTNAYLDRKGLHFPTDAKVKTDKAVEEKPINSFLNFAELKNDTNDDFRAEFVDDMLDISTIFDTVYKLITVLKHVQSKCVVRNTAMKTSVENAWRNLRQDGKSVAKYVEKLEQLTFALADQGVNKSDDEVSRRFLEGLDDMYEMARTTLSLKKTDLNFLSVQGDILSVEQNAKSQSIAMAGLERGTSGRTGKGKGNGSKTSGFRGKCYGCKKDGHMKRNCPNKHEWSGKADHHKAPGKAVVGHTTNTMTAMDIETIVANAIEAKLMSMFGESSMVGLEVVKSKVFASTQRGSLQRDNWLLDSGSQRHMTNTTKYLSNIRKSNVPILIQGVGEKILSFDTVGDVQLGKVLLKDVVYAPHLPTNLVSSGKLLTEVSNMGFKDPKISFGKHRWVIEAKNPQGRWVTVQGGIIKNHLQLVKRPQESYKAIGNTEEAYLGTIAKKFSPASLEKLHEKIGHTGISSLKKMLKNPHVTGLTPKNVDEHYCSNCSFGRMSKQRAPQRVIKKSEIREVGDVLCIDFATNKPAAKNGHKNFVVISDKKSNYILVAESLASIKDAAPLLKMAINNAKRWGWSPKALQSDRDTTIVNTGGPINVVCCEFGIEIISSPSEVHSLNGSAEFLIGHFNVTIATLLKDSGFPITFWHYALRYAAHVWNHTTNSTTIPPPKCQWMRLESVDLSHIYPFGQPAIIYSSKEAKLEGRAQIARLLYFHAQYTGCYHFLNMMTKRTVVSSSVVFPKRIGNSVKEGTTNALKGETSVSEPTLDTSSEDAEEETDGTPMNIDFDYTINDTIPISTAQVPPPAVVPAPVRRGRGRPRRNGNVVDAIPPEFLRRSQRRPTQSIIGANAIVSEADASELSLQCNELPSEYVESVYVGIYPIEYALVSDFASDPKSSSEALKLPQWRDSMRQEFLRHIEYCTFQVEENQAAIKTILPAKFVFRTKRDEKGKPIKNKSRMTLQGFRQKAWKGDYDPNDITAPVSSYTSLMLMNAVISTYNCAPNEDALNNDMELWQCDVVVAYLNSEMGASLHLKLSPAELDLFVEVLSERDDSNSRKELAKIQQLLKKREPVLFKILKAIYGGKQSARQWNKMLVDILVDKMKFKQLLNEPCSFVLEKSPVSNNPIVLSIYVDDLLIGATKRDKDWFYETLSKHVKLTGGDIAKFFLGFNVMKINGSLAVNQATYIAKLLKTHGLGNLEEVKTLSTPMPTKYDMIVADKPMDKTKYRSLVGGLMYLLNSRPDIAYAVNILARKFNEPREMDYKLGKRILRYLAGTINLGFYYSSKPKSNLIAYSDASWADDKRTLRSSGGYVIYYCGAPVQFKSHLQRNVALSSCESEEVELSFCVQACVAIKSQLEELKAKGLSNIQVPEKIIVYCDNTSAIEVASVTHVNHKKLKHLLMHKFYVKEKVKAGEVEIRYVRTDENVADIFTKSLDRSTFEKHRNSLLVDLENIQRAHEMFALETKVM